MSPSDKKDPPGDKPDNSIKDPEPATGPEDIPNLSGDENEDQEEDG